MAAKVAAGAVVAAAAVTARTIRHYQVHKRLLLDSQQPLRYPSSDVHVITALAPHDDDEMEVLVEGLEDEIAAAGGRRVYIGRVLAPGGRSSQMPEVVQASVRVVLVTQWPSAEAFIAFRAAALPPAGEGEFWLAEGCGWRGAWSTLWKRSPMMGVVTPLMMGWSRARSLLCAFKTAPLFFLRRDCRLLCTGVGSGTMSRQEPSPRKSSRRSRTAARVPGLRKASTAFLPTRQWEGAALLCGGTKTRRISRS